MMGLFLLVIFAILMRIIYVMFLPSKCTECNVTLIKGHIKRIGMQPYCLSCYNKIEMENLKE